MLNSYLKQFFVLPQPEKNIKYDLSLFNHYSINSNTYQIEDKTTEKALVYKPSGRWDPGRIQMHMEGLITSN
jgi:hypothetical protein